MATIAQLEALYQEKVAERNALGARYEAGETYLLPDIQALNTEIRALVLQIEALQARPVQSTGQTVANAQLANDDRADTVRPNPPQEQLTSDGQVVPTPQTTTPSNAAGYEFDSDAGTDGVLRPAGRVQSTPGTVANPGAAVPNGTNNSYEPNGLGDFIETGVVYSGSTSGAAAGSDDSGAGMNAVAAALQNLYGTNSERVIPQSNILDRYASYTYNISIYLATPTQYQRLITNKRKSVSGFSLLMSSAGYPITGASAFNNETETLNETFTQSSQASRNQFFPLDYYLDNIQLKTLVNGKGTMSAHMATELNFRVIEPNGITFIQNLAAATTALAQKTNNDSNAYLNQLYLMVIRFYGYDINGKLIQTTTESNANQSDRTAISEKFIPFIFTGIKFKVGNKLTEYDCQAVTPQNMIASGQQRGVIPYNIELTSKTLNELLSVDLATALNGYQAQFVKDGIFTYADRYEFKLLAPLNSTAVSVVPPGQTNITSTPMVNVENARDALLMQTNSVDKTSKNNSATAGQSIVQFIDQKVRTSDYVYLQQNKIYDPKTNQLKDKPGAGKLFAWYRIGLQAVPQLDKWDPKRSDYAYTITYQVAPYLVTDVLSDYFPQSPRWTAPKEYYHWFTGQNSQILDYNQDFNNLYYFVVNSAQNTYSTSPLKNASKKGYQPNSNQSSQGIEGKVNEPSANAADYLYSPADLARVRMTIIGDPDWIQQGDVWEGISGDNFTSAAFLPDGTINYESREPLFDVIFNTPADYNSAKGIVDTGSGTQPLNQPTGTARTIEQRARYKAYQVTHYFTQGKFTQDLEGVLILPEVSTNTAAANAQQAQTSFPVTNTVTGTVNDVNLSTTRTPENSAAAITTAGGNSLPWTAVNQQIVFGSASQLNTATDLNSTALQSLTVLAPTSAGVLIGTATSPSNTNYATGGVNIQQVATVVPLIAGGTQVVTSEQQATELYNQGLITFQSANRATVDIRSRTAAQQSPVTASALQQGSRDP